MRPLCKSASDSFDRQWRNARVRANKGLVFDRFYDGYDASWNTDQKATKALGQLIGTSGEHRQIEQAVSRRIRLVTGLGGEFGVFRTDGYFVTGMGNAHPAENGFTWHPVLGTPYLPGSGVKGLLRAWMETCASAENGSGEQNRLYEWFGCDSGAGGDDGNGKAGDLVFFDALPVAPPDMAVDVMTPHMGKWYEQGGASATPESMPGDWHDPVPVPFLVVKEARFLFAVAPRVPGASGAAREAMALLGEALAWLGAGAKTAAGYGHMSFDEQETRRYQGEAEAEAEETRRAAMTPGQRMMEDIEKLLRQDQAADNREPGGNCKHLLREASDQAETWPMEERKALLELARRVLEHHDGEKWKKKNKPKQLYAKIRQLAE